MSECCNASAAEVEERLRARGPELARSFLKLADIAFAMGSYQEVIDMMDAVVELQPQDTRGYLAKGRAHQCLKQVVEAEACFAKIVELCPTSAASHVNLGEIAWREHQDVDGAREHFELAAKHDPEGPDGAR
ncbi:tetratricopeptide repeat protein, partial [Myxococcota bacterium]